MPKIKILVIYAMIDLLIGAGVIWCVLRGMRVSQYLVPASVLFVLNGVWLVVMVVRSTPQGNADTHHAGTKTRRKPLRH